MVDLIGAAGLSISGMEAQGRRLRHVTENLANIDTPGYRRKVIAFQPAPDGSVRVGPVRLDPRPVSRIHDPAHPLADAAGYRAGTNVELMVEIADAREAQRSYDANLRMFEQARQMTQGLIDLLRR